MAGDRSGSGKPIALKAADVRHLQLAKGSMHAAMQTLIIMAGTSDDELDEILLAERSAITSRSIAPSASALYHPWQRKSQDLSVMPRGRDAACAAVSGWRWSC